MKSNLQCLFTAHAGHLILPGWNQVTQLSQILTQDNLRNASMYWCLLWTNIPSPDLHSLASWEVTLWIGTIVKKFQQLNTNNKIKWKGKAKKFRLSKMIGSWSSVTKYRKQAIRSWQASSLYWLVSQVDKKRTETSKCWRQPLCDGEPTCK